MDLAGSLRRGSGMFGVVSVVGVLLASVTAFAVVFVQNANSNSAIRQEAEREVLTADLRLATQIEAEQANLFITQVSDEPHDHHSMEMEMGSKAEDASPGDIGDDRRVAPFDHHPEVISAIAIFEQAASELRRVLPDSELELLNTVVAAHSDYIASLAELDARAHDGATAMMLYHEDTQVLEALLRSRLHDLGSGSAWRLQSAIEDARSAEALLRFALPMIVIAGIVAAVVLLRTVTTRSRLAMLETLVRAKDEFIGAVSHELRTPLTGIVGFANLLHEAEDTLTPEERAELVASIADQSQDVTAIVEDLLVGARAEIGELSIVTLPVDLRAQASQVLEMLEPTTSYIGVIGLDPGVLADPMRVRQIVRNLVTNAVRHGTGGIEVELGADHHHGFLRVHSDGPPISDDDRERIFEPYQRAYGSDGTAGSIGLGLAVSRQLARLMDGDIRYLRGNGRNTFELRLPLDTTAAVREPVELVQV